MHAARRLRQMHVEGDDVDVARGGRLASRKGDRLARRGTVDAHDRSLALDETQILVVGQFPQQASERLAGEVRAAEAQVREDRLVQGFKIHLGSTAPLRGARYNCPMNVDETIRSLRANALTYCGRPGKPEAGHEPVKRGEAAPVPGSTLESGRRAWRAGHVI